MARPRTLKDKLRNIEKTVSFNSEEYNIIKRKAKIMKMNCSRYIREATLSTDEARLPIIRLSAIAAIRKIGINHNQIAHYLNTVMLSGGSVNTGELMEHFKKIDTQLKEAISELRIK